MQRTPIQIRFNDIDILGHVNNVMFGHYCDVARSDYFLNKTSPITDFQNDNKVLIQNSIFWLRVFLPIPFL